MRIKAKILSDYHLFNVFCINFSENCFFLESCAEILIFGFFTCACKGSLIYRIYSHLLAPLLFVCSAGDWTQMLGVFSSKGNIKADMLSKLLLEAILLAEKAGLFVDFVSCDGATWNRSMWKSFGIGGMTLCLTCNLQH